MQQNCIIKSIDINKSTKPFDILGISSATLCLVHCVAFPIITLIPLGITDNCYIDVLFAVIGMLVVLKIIRSGAPVKVKVILGISIVLLLASVLLDILFEIHSGLLYVGGLGMIIGHVLNFRGHNFNSK